MSVVEGCDHSLAVNKTNYIKGVYQYDIEASVIDTELIYGTSASYISITYLLPQTPMLHQPVR